MKAVRRLAHRVRRRGAALLFFALLDLVFGSQMLLNASELQAVPLYHYADTLMPLQAWGVAWLTVGVVCTVQAFTASDRIAFAAAALVKAGWGLVTVGAWLLAGAPRGYLGAAVWIAFSGFVMVISTWPEPDDTGPGSDGNAEAVISADSQGIITGWNAAAVRMFGWHRTEIIGKSLETLVPSRLLGQHRAGYARAALTGRSQLGGQVLRVTAVRRGGVEFPIELAVSAWDSGGEVTFTGLIREARAGAGVE